MVYAQATGSKDFKEGPLCRSQRVGPEHLSKSYPHILNRIGLRLMCG
jgi:hypothetical protein